MVQRLKVDALEGLGERRVGRTSMMPGCVLARVGVISPIVRCGLFDYYEKTMLRVP